MDTVVTWSMVGKLSFIPRLVGIFMSMEKMCGTSFETGLAEMRSIVETQIGIRSRTQLRVNPALCA